MERDTTYYTERGLLTPAEDAESLDRRAAVRPVPAPARAVDWPLHDPEEQTPERRAYWQRAASARGPLAGLVPEDYRQRLLAWAGGAA